MVSKGRITQRFRHNFCEHPKKRRFESIGKNALEKVKEVLPRKTEVDVESIVVPYPPTWVKFKMEWEKEKNRKLSD